jgi:hypothetical protein
MLLRLAVARLLADSTSMVAMLGKKLRHDSIAHPFSGYSSLKCFLIYFWTVVNTFDITLNRYPVLH